MQEHQHVLVLLVCLCVTVPSLFAACCVGDRRRSGSCWSVDTPSAAPSYRVKGTGELCPLALGPACPTLPLCLVSMRHPRKVVSSTRVMDACFHTLHALTRCMHSHVACTHTMHAFTRCIQGFVWTLALACAGMCVRSGHAGCVCRPCAAVCAVVCMTCA
jgi:hypothetical protein